MSDDTLDHPNEDQTWGLGSGSSRGLDELVAAGFDLARGASPEARRLSDLLAMLAQPDPAGPTLAAGSDTTPLLVSLTMARVLRASEQDLAGRIHPVGGPEQLEPVSAEAVDELASRHWSAPSHSRNPVASLLSLLATINPPGVAERDRLIESTLAGVQRQIDSSNTRFRLSPERSTSSARSGFRLRDLVGVAAAIVLCASVVWPMLAGSREQAREAQCSANLSRAALGFSNYAADNQGRLPQARASFLGGTWWDVGKQNRSHSANLYVLVRNGYASLTDLSCPGNAAAPTAPTEQDVSDWRSPEEVSYSYQLFGPGRPGWNSGARFVVLTDKSPVIQRARLGERVNPDESSRNHAGQGQNLLFGDGSLRFEARPILPGGDNIWLPSGASNFSGRLTGRETPDHDDDAFVGP